MITQRKNLIRRIVYTLLIILTLIFILFKVLNSYVNDSLIKIGEIANTSDRVLFVFAHPDDEMTVAGTLANLNKRKIPTAVICLTKGEAGKTGGIVSKEKLGEERVKELKRVKSILGIDYLKILDFPDSGILDTNPSLIKNAILTSIKEFNPTVIVSPDKTVGLYGHDDHRLTGLYVYELLKSSSLKKKFKYYMVTLPKPMINLALKMSPTFKNRYPKDPDKGLPKAKFAVKINSFSSLKRKAMEAHKTQKQVIEKVMPYCMSIYPSIYFNIFDREYYHKVY